MGENFSLNDSILYNRFTISYEKGRCISVNKHK